MKAGFPGAKDVQRNRISVHEQRKYRADRRKEHTNQRPSIQNKRPKGIESSDRKMKKNTTGEKEPERITGMMDESERTNRIAMATNGGVQRGKGTRQITAGMVIRTATDEGNEHTYKTGRIGGPGRDETPISPPQAEITAAEAAI